MLRRQRGVHGDRPARLAAGRAQRPHRAAHRTGAGDAPGAPRDADIDLAFIDADKGGYPAYFDELLLRLRPGGVILADNTLWSGRVVDADSADENTRAIQTFNDKVAADDRVESCILPVSDGLTIIRKR